MQETDNINKKVQENLESFEGKVSKTTLELESKIAQLSKLKTRLAIAFVIGFLVVAFESLFNFYYILFAFLGALIAILILDLDLLVYTYFLDSDSRFAKNVKETINSSSKLSKKIKAYYAIVKEYEYKIDGFVFRSALFQVLNSFFALYLALLPGGFFIKSMLISIAAQLFYIQIIEHSETKTIARWFKGFKNANNPNFYKTYFVLMGVALVMALYLLLI